MKLLMILSMMLNLFASNAQQKSIDSAQWAEMRWIVYQLSFLDTVGFRKEDKRIDSIIKAFSSNTSQDFIFDPFAGSTLLPANIEWFNVFQSKNNTDSTSWNLLTNNPTTLRSNDFYPAVSGDTFTWNASIESTIPNGYCLIYVKSKDAYVAAYYISESDTLFYLTEDKDADLPRGWVELTSSMKSADFFKNKKTAVECIQKHQKLKKQLSHVSSSAVHEHTRTMKH